MTLLLLSLLPSLFCLALPPFPLVLSLTPGMLQPPQAYPGRGGSQ